MWWRRTRRAQTSVPWLAHNDCPHILDAISVRRNDGGHDLSTIRKTARDRSAHFSLGTYRPCERCGSRNALHQHAAPSMNDSYAPPNSSSSLRIFFICGRYRPMRFLDERRMFGTLDRVKVTTV
jgi:hypothetical protein